MSEHDKNLYMNYSKNTASISFLIIYLVTMYKESS